jgi:hypothetical protein
MTEQTERQFPAQRRIAQNVIVLEFASRQISDPAADQVRASASGPGARYTEANAEKRSQIHGQCRQYANNNACK